MVFLKKWWTGSKTAQSVSVEADVVAHLNDDGVAHDGVSENNSNSPQKPRRRWWIGLLFVLVIVPLLLVSAVVWMIQSESGTRTLLTATDKLTNGMVHADWTSGSLAHGGSASSINIHLSNVDVDITNIVGEWSWRYLPLKWNVENLVAEQVDVTIFPKDDDGKLLEKVLIPLSIDGKHVKVETVNIIRGLSTTVLKNIEGATSTDQRFHRIDLTHLSQGDAEYNGQLDIDGMRPFALTSKIKAISNYEKSNYTLDVSAQGDLYHLNLDVQAGGGTKDKRLNGVGQLEIQTLERYYIHKAHVDITHLNPYAFWNKLLKADLDIALEATPQAILTETSEQKTKGKDNRQPVNGHLTVINHAPAPLSAFSLPASKATGDFDLTRDEQILKNIDMQVSNGGRITGGGAWHDKDGEFKFDVKDFDLKNIHPKMLATRLGGTVNLIAARNSQHVVATLLNSGAHPLKLFVDTIITPEHVEIKQATVTGAGAAKLETNGLVKYTQGFPYEGKATLTQFNLADLGDFPSSKLAGDFKFDGVVKPDVKFNVKGALNDSVWVGAPTSAKIDISYNAPDSLTARELDVTVGVNHATAKGTMGITKETRDKLSFNVNAPNLAQLQFDFGGSLTAKGELTGSLLKPRGTVEASANALKFGEQTIKLAQLNGQWDSGKDGAMVGKLDLQDYKNNRIVLNTVHLDVNGTQSAHEFSTKVQGHVLIRDGEGASGNRAATPPVQWILNANASGSGGIVDTGWRGQLNQFVNQGQPNITLQRPVSFELNKGELQVKSLAALVQGAQLDVERLNVLGMRVNSRGRVNNLIVPQWLTWLNISLPFYTDMSVKGEWDMTMGDSPTGGFRFEREKGDLSFDAKQKSPIALNKLMLDGRMVGHNVAVTGELNSDKFGQVLIDGNIGLISGATGWVMTSGSPLNLNARAKLDKLQQFNSLLGTNVKLSGQIQANINIKGALSAPMMSGQLTGQNLDFLHIDQGFRLKDGVIKMNLTESQVDFEQFDFNGVEGKLSVRGKASYGGTAGRALTAQVSMDKLKPFVRLDRNVVLSGQAALGYDGGNQLSVKGKLHVDKALIDLPATLPPSLSGDVSVCSIHPAKSIRCYKTAAEDKAEAKIVPTIDLALELGDHFRFKGQGADVSLTGGVQLTSNQGSPLRTTGVVKIEEGTYKFYGQVLKVQRGLISFQGPYDDPALNMLATRTIGSTEVGVELTGTLADSHARLTSTPEMPDEEKLSWLLFSRSSSTLSTSDGSAIAGAAAILLGTDQGRRITDKLGIDSFNFGKSESGLTGTVVGVGKRLSDKFSVAYEQGIDSVAGVVKVTWSVSRNWQLLMRGGSINGADVQYSRRFDKF